MQREASLQPVLQCLTCQNVCAFVMCNFASVGPFGSLQHAVKTTFQHKPIQSTASGCHGLLILQWSWMECIHTVLYISCVSAIQHEVVIVVLVSAVQCAARLDTWQPIEEWTLTM